MPIFKMYIIYSELRDRYYIGSTGNIETRLKTHNEGNVKSTKYGIPWILVYSEEFETKTYALKREFQIKRKKSRKYIEWLINK